jgi:SagB-type dehydrogenase family enzyme
MKVSAGQMRKSRTFLKDSVRKEFDFSQTDQSRGVPPPPFEKPLVDDQKVVDLIPPKEWKHIVSVDIATVIKRRRSQRVFLDTAVSLEEVSFLLWATQGVVRTGSAYTMRTVPSAGARHAFETYLCVMRAKTLAPGVYRYLPVSNRLALEFTDDILPEKIVSATLGQQFAGQAAVVFIWAAVPYRMEWRYGPASHKVMALDAGHICQNLYLACEAVSCGTCAIAAYDQAGMDQLLKLDGEDEFVVYLAPVGKTD